MRRLPVRSRWVALAGVAAFCGVEPLGAAELAPPGFRPSPLGAHALIGARVFTRPGSELARANIIIRDGRIVGVGPEASPPADARIWDLTGQVVYAGFVDPYVQVAAAGGPAPAPPGDGEVAANTFTAAGQRFYGVTGQERDAGAPGPGYPNAEVTPERRMAASYVPDGKLIEGLREQGFTAANMVPSAGVIRGQSALVALGDGGPNETVLRPDTSQHVAFAVSAGDDAFPNSLMGVIALVRQALLDTQFQVADQADYASRPSGRPRPAFNPSLAALNAVLPGTNRQAVVIEPGSALMVERATFLAAEFGLQIRVVSSGQEWRRPDLAKAAGAPFIVPIAFPALPKFPDESGWESVTLDQLRNWDWAPENPAVLRQQGIDVALTTHALGDRKEFRKNLRAAIERGLSETDALAALTTVPARLCGMSQQLGAVEPGMIANLTVCDAKGYFDPEGKVRAVWVEGRPHEFPEAAAGAAPAKPPKDEAQAKADTEKAEKKKREAAELARKRAARSVLAGRGPLASPPAVLIRSATVWTSGPQGILTNATLLVVGGRIQSVGAAPAGALPEGTQVIDLPGIHVTPGLLDCHSHSMILGAVNEMTLPSTALVRIGDVVNSETDNIHQQLAGGLTVANLLHGSANPIGGQNCVIKLRDGAGPEDLKFRNAPQGIKFALGENVKQANWGEKYTTRFPQSRMGVQTFYQNRFTAARQYAEAQRKAAAGGPPVRRDLELDALVEILDGRRLIHCHSYRQDEILAFLRTMESFGVRVATLQHILEGYKVADEIARHGAGASAFADWWNYKFEVVDAIPYAGSLMRDRGVVVSFNSDSSDHARRLNFEAAKAVKYGGTPEAEALKFVTINPAKQLGVDAWVGSLEPGKDGDFAVWNGSPLDSGSLCLETWIEGRQYFDRSREKARAHELVDERAALIAKAKKVSGEGGEGAAAGDKAREAFFQQALEHASTLGIHQCLNCRMPQRN